MMHEHLMKSLGDVARTARERLQMNQAAIAKNAGISPAVYGRIERGHMMPAVPTLRKIAVALSISADVLLGISPKEVAKKMEDPPPEGDLSPELRRLVRTLKTWPDAKIKLLSGFAKLLDSVQVLDSEPEK
ncbi:helix-turn-helix domain-containing protein [Cystobacter fuscus]|uniref:helix-turn-helix domain-containing protein n=1 Tax=Cystobacter fuscus TaxID=43 RepID=UPI002B309C3F|nr:helix-turn-helix domain-containing protein [Cystobacter fuscus]